MRAIELFHLRRVRDKPRALAEMRARAGLSEAEALAVLHGAIGGGRPRLVLPDDAAARDCIAALADTGFVARFTSAPDFDAPERAQSALLTVLDRLPAAVGDEVGARLLASQWQHALDHALQHLRMHRPADDADRQRLAQIAVETGLVCGVPGLG